MRFKSAVIATGSRPSAPPIPGLDDEHCLDSTRLLEIDHVPERLLVLGGGVIGCEFASIFSHFGSQVTIIEMLPNLIGKEDADAVKALERAFKKRGVEVALGARATRVERNDGGLQLVYADANGQEHVVGADRILVSRRAASRTSRTSGSRLRA